MMTTPPTTPGASPAPTSTGSADLAPGAGEPAALAAALAGEQAAVYAYGVVGAQAGPAHRRRALESLAAHGVQRDLLAGMVSVTGSPRPAEPAYALPFAVRSVADARRLAAHVEQSLAAVYADLVLAAAAPRRTDAAGWLARCAVEAHRWGAATQPFPGLPERG